MYAQCTCKKRKAIKALIAAAAKEGIAGAAM
jgi:hypothetical protein